MDYVSSLPFSLLKCANYLNVNKKAEQMLKIRATAAFVEGGGSLRLNIKLKGFVYR